jgi:hypothetical protein
MITPLYLSIESLTFLLATLGSRLNILYYCLLNNALTLKNTSLALPGRIDFHVLLTD